MSDLALNTGSRLAPAGKLAGAPAATSTAASEATTSRLVLVLFMASFLVPGWLHLGSVTLGLPRLFLFVMFVPNLITALRAPEVRWCRVDTLILGFIIWMDLSILVNNGFGRIQFVGLQTVDMTGAYILARAHVRTLGDYRFFWRAFGIAMLIIFPIAFVELIVNRLLLQEIFRSVISVFPNSTAHYPPRWGFDRVQGNFEHPILFGVFWSMGFATFLTLYRSIVWRFFFTAVSGAMVFMSLSSGAYLMAMFQSGLTAYGWATKGAWKQLLWFCAVVYVVVDLVSNRPALIAISTRLAFSSGTAYARVNIWDYGSRNVMAHPLFGLGLNDWVRPSWLGSSIDNNWLLMAVRGGLPAIGLLFAAFGTMLYMLLRRRDLPAAVRPLRTSYVITFISMFTALGTVAVWSGTASFLFFLLGLGVTLASIPAATAAGMDTGGGTGGNDAPEAAAPRFMRPARAIPERAAPVRAAPERAAPERAAPERAAERMAPARARLDPAGRDASRDAGRDAGRDHSLGGPSRTPPPAPPRTGSAAPFRRPFSSDRGGGNRSR